MNSSRFFTLKEARIGNNCPECYSNDSLELTFKQKLIETKLYKAITDETVCQLRCLNCEVQIFPIRWTNDIERVVDYHKRGLKTKPKSTKLKPIALGLVVFGVIVLIVIVLFALGIL
ncbi:hypothetical protein [Winogradskyella helgolandensis]|jgi:hypothetical protein|uniref:hypothetical protein n=1 Tax=Winogradskyella helgolandensis TaxID=2697010 RepID=UPI0015BC86EB|nr:hypothetical protein [Winogradskyella helgolandensis]